MYPLRIARGENDLIFDENGHSYIDLFSAHGTTWLGHADPEITAAVTRQLEHIWGTGGLETDASSTARALVESFFPPTHALVALYSTGMESSEFAIRLARTVTRRCGVIGFERSMHGKSLATAYLGWDNHDDVGVADFVRLPFVPSCPEDEILGRLDDALASRAISAVFVEPLQGSGGGHRASPLFYQEVSRLCAPAGRPAGL